MDYITISEQDFYDLEREYASNRKKVAKKRYVAKISNGYLAMDNTNGEGFVEQCSSKALVDEFFNNGLGYDDDYSNFEQIKHKQNYY